MRLQVRQLGKLNSWPARLESEDAVLREAASLFGIDVSQFGDRKVDFAALFQAADRAGFVPVDFDQNMAKRTLMMMRHNAALGQKFRPGRFDGNLLFFFATEKKEKHQRPEAWQPFITGAIEVHNIHCKHGQMADPGPLKEVGRILERHLQMQNSLQAAEKLQ